MKNGFLLLGIYGRLSTDKFNLDRCRWVCNWSGKSIDAPDAAISTAAIVGASSVVQAGPSDLAFPLT